MASYVFRRDQRVRRAAEFRAIYRNGLSKRTGPLIVHALPNSLGHDRLGLSVSRRVGGAVRRNRVKRLLREAFRHLPGGRSVGYDIVVTVRPHAPIGLDACAAKLGGALDRLHRRWGERDRPA